MTKIKIDRIYSVRAYCSKCGKFLMESSKMNKKELLVNWDSAVLKAPGIRCEDCNTPVPNFYLNLKIHNSATNKNYDPKFVMPKPDVKLESLGDLLT